MIHSPVRRDAFAGGRKLLGPLPPTKVDVGSNTRWWTSIQETLLLYSRGTMDMRSAIKLSLNKIIDVVFTACIFLTLVSFTRAGDSGLEVYAPWAVAKQVDPKSNELQFVAMTPALNDHSIWLLMACAPAQSEVQVYLIAANSFSHPLPDQARLELRLDDLPPVPSLADTAEGRLVRLRTPAARELAAQIDRGSHLTVSIQGLNAQGHD